jgi:hypothetical protein
MSLLTVSQLALIARGQEERRISEKSKRSYMSQCKVMTQILMRCPDLYSKAFVCVDGVPQKHTGEGNQIYKLRLPLDVDVGTALFAAISIDENLPLRKRKTFDDSATVVTTVEENAGLLDHGDDDLNSDAEIEEHDGNDNRLASLDRATSMVGTSSSFPNPAIDSNSRVRNVLSSGNDGSQHEASVDAMNPSRNKRTVSAQTYQNYKSALRWWHTYNNPEMEKVGYPWPEELNNIIAIQISAYKRDVGAKKRQGTMKQREGKLPYNLFGYKTISKFFAQMQPKKNMYTWSEGIFAGLFTKLSVNTIGRSDNIDDLLFSNMDWLDDSLTICFGTTKADQAGEKTSDVKRIFANPFLPELCCILQLAIYVWCTGVQEGNNGRFLFPGTDQNKRYYNILKVAMANIDSKIDLGARREDIGTHSNRKFAESTSVSKIDGPSRTQVCLRAGQGVGRTQDCYMFSEDDGDALVGRTVAQLQLNADEFDVLPPHFDHETLKELEEYGWTNILSDHNKYPDSFRERVIPFLFAQLVYHWHEGKLASLLPAAHPLFQQKIFRERGLIDSLKGKVVFEFGYCEKTMMAAHGVPGLILVSREIRKFRAHYDTTCKAFSEGLEVLKRSIEGMESGIYADLPGEIVGAILQRVAVNGAVPISMTDIRKVISEMIESPTGVHSKIMTTLTEIEANQKLLMEKHGAVSTSSSTGAVNATSQDIASKPFFDESSRTFLHFWGGKLHRVPNGFVFPSYDTRTVWHLWFEGRPADKISPLRRINAAEDLVTAVCKSNFHRTKRVVKGLVKILVSEGRVESEKEVSADNATTCFDYAFPILIASLYNAEYVPERVFDININTIANRMSKQSTA